MIFSAGDGYLEGFISITYKMTVEIFPMAELSAEPRTNLRLQVIISRRNTKKIVLEMWMIWPGRELPNFLVCSPSIGPTPFCLPSKALQACTVLVHVM